MPFFHFQFRPVFAEHAAQDQPVEIFVSSGQLFEPYYIFLIRYGSSINLDSFEFYSGHSYRFVGGQAFNPHPFQIGSAPGTPSEFSVGGPISSIGDELVLNIPTDFDPYTSSLYFYCTEHTYMNGQLKVVSAVESDGNDSEWHDDNEDGGLVRSWPRWYRWNCR